MPTQQQEGAPSLALKPQQQLHPQAEMEEEEEKGATNPSSSSQPAASRPSLGSRLLNSLFGLHVPFLSFPSTVHQD